MPPPGASLTGPAADAYQPTAPPTARTVSVPVPPDPSVSRPGVTSSRATPGAQRKSFAGEPPRARAGPAGTRAPSGKAAGMGLPARGAPRGMGLGSGARAPGG
ncbi:MAG: hypothetical protein JWL99_791, partial [Streptomyces oryziradicis]|nr:hypothetical protein [Actinacidiphila oryziradicis]